MTDGSGRRDLFRRVLGRAPRPAKDGWRRGVGAADEDEVRAALEALEPAPPGAAPPRPAHLDALLARGDAAPPDARGPGSQRGRRLPLLPIVRPPGAVEEARFVEACDACGACKDACPHDAIRGLDDRHGPLRGTPTIRAIDAPCQMCDGFPCVAACDRGALLATAPTRIGVATIRQFDCLASGSFCSTCVERCPAPGAIEAPAGRPTIVEDRCTGCGICQHVCPAPRNAVLIVAPPERMEGA